MMPMGGMAGAGGDDRKQKGRRGWLQEDDDVWGANRDDVAPRVLGEDPDDRKDRDKW